MRPWKRDLAYICEVGPDEPRFDAAVQRVWDRCEELEAALREIDRYFGSGLPPAGFPLGAVRSLLAEIEGEAT